MSDIENAISDAKLAKSVHDACKSHGKKALKRGADGTASSQAKKPRLDPHKHDLDYGSMPAEELESSLSLPLVEDEEAIRHTTLITNRAPLVLAFAVELLRFTMPEQPLSSRLSLAQAVVSANSRSKAISLGIEKTSARDQEQISDGQPKVRVMGREIPVLKRGGYTGKGAEGDTSHTSSTSDGASVSADKRIWTASKKRTCKASTFMAHVASVCSPSLRADLMKTLFADNADLESATHNAWAVRTSYGHSPLVQEASFDDGEQGCGRFLLQMMREAAVTNTLVVLTMWYGGVMLGPDRWRLMREAVDDALSAQQCTASLAGEAVWALDPQDRQPATSTVGMAIHRPERARNYLLRTFTTALADSSPTHASARGGGKKTAAAANEERQDNLGRLLGALRMLFASWAGTLSRDELDRKAWSWYVLVRPDVEAGPAGWGAKGPLSLGRILDLRRGAAEAEA